MKSQEIVNTLATLKQKSLSVNSRAQVITMANGGELASGGGPYPQVIAGIHEIMSTMTNLTDDIHVGETHTGPDADAIVEAYKDFVRTHQVLLHLLTGKGALFKATPEVGKAMQDILRAEREVVESAGNVLASAVPPKSAEFKTQTLALSKTITATIRAH